MPTPGPFAFGDVGYVRGILEQVGFGDIRHETIEHDISVPDDAIADQESITPLRLNQDRAAAAWNDLQAHANAFKRADGLLHIRIAPQIFQATNPACQSVRQLRHAGRSPTDG